MYHRFTYTCTSHIIEQQNISFTGDSIIFIVESVVEKSRESGDGEG